MAENGIKEKIIGVAFDGSGYGTDKKIWGSEFIVCDLTGFERTAHFKYIPLPGGEKAIKECWRTAVSLLYHSNGWNIFENLEKIGFFKKYKKKDIDMILKIIENPTFSPLSSGAGRLFDAVAAILGICDRNTFEGEAALCLESTIIEKCSELDLESEDAIKKMDTEKYPYEIVDSQKPFVIDFSDMISCIIEDIKKGRDKGTISLRFHNTIVDVILKVVNLISEKTKIKNVALSGGVFQNRYLLEKTIKGLLDSDLQVHTNGKVPPNDAGISLGQAYLLASGLAF
jgi:hydrogenase maturation protein HypF